ncbi:MAG: sigma 54-interacting transcriptional regulator, partial [Candidatus Poribacteria bacterium]|nr:sigma 54-interacting transcriptional regulator [Candidatus Poribacteria bacterium]
VAQAIHANGTRRKGPFVPVDCPAIAGDLFGSELFGHERGAFTGATERRIGKFELAQGGTLFLDEVTEIEPILQAKLLRVLQERVIHRVGGDKPIPVDVQIIAATNRDVIAAIEAGEFRRDLYYRLLGFDEIVVPPLRERREDIPLLAEHFLRQHADSGSVTKTFISQEAMDLLVMIDWEGNVRELKGAIESAAIWANREGTTIHPRHLPTRYSTSRPTLPMHSSGDTLRDRLNEMERWMIQGALSAANHNIAAAARELGMDPSNLRRRMSTLAIIT